MDAEKYIDIKEKLISSGYANEIDYISELQECSSAESFFLSYLWVVLNSGMKEQIARKIYEKILKSIDNNFPIENVFKHKGKIKAIKSGMRNYKIWFSRYKNKNSVGSKLEYLEKLPFIGKITKYHLLRNLGNLDFCKPDRHLIRIADNSNTTPQKLCEKLSKETGDKIGVIDVIIWRACNLRII